jgi:hypothetical protein
VKNQSLSFLIGPPICAVESVTYVVVGAVSVELSASSSSVMLLPVIASFSQSVSTSPEKILLPERNRLFDATPVKPPNSALAPRPISCTSWIQLWFEKTQIVPPSGSLTSTPSIMYEFDDCAPDPYDE